MKKLLVIFMAILLLCPLFVSAESIDLESLSREELISLIDDANEALKKFDENVNSSSGTIWIDQDGILLTYRDMELSGNFLRLNVTLENNSDINISVMNDNVYVNGWQVEGGMVDDVAPGKKAQDFFELWSMEDVEVRTLDDIQRIEFDLEILDAESYEAIFTVKGIVVE